MPSTYFPLPLAVFDEVFKEAFPNEMAASLLPARDSSNFAAFLANSSQNDRAIQIQKFKQLHGPVKKNNKLTRGVV